MIFVLPSPMLHSVEWNGISFDQVVLRAMRPGLVLVLLEATNATCFLMSLVASVYSCSIIVGVYIRMYISQRLARPIRVYKGTSSREERWVSQKLLASLSVLAATLSTGSLNRLHQSS